MKQVIRGSLMLTVCLFSCSLPAATDAPPAFTNEAQGDWHVLAAHRNNQNIATGARVSSRVSITADSITWHDPEKAAVPLIRTACVRAEKPEATKKSVDPNELSSTVRGSLCLVQDAKLAARWRITSDGVLLVLIQVAEYKGNRTGTYSGARPAEVLLVCQRKPVPAALPPDPQGDAKRLIGEWVVLAEFDDANVARTRPQGNVEFTAQGFVKRGSYSPDARPSMTGTWN